MALTLRSGLIAGLLAALDAGDVDLILGPIHADLPDRYSPQPLLGEELVLVTPPGHPRARTPRLTLADPRDEPFVCLPQGSGLRAILDQAAVAAGFAPRVEFETMDDFAPSSDWPRRYRGEVDQLRMTYLSHPELKSVEVRVSVDEVVIEATRVSR